MQMMNIFIHCNQYLNNLQVQFELRDVNERGFSPKSFDCIFTRETIVHIQNKLELFKNFHVKE